jgi:hypothetical protein
VADAVLPPNAGQPAKLVSQASDAELVYWHDRINDGLNKGTASDVERAKGTLFEIICEQRRRKKAAGG